MKAWSTWFVDLAAHVPGCPNILMEHELRRSAQAFFRATRAWKNVEAARPVLAGTSMVPVQPADSTTELVRIEDVYFEGKKLMPTTEALLASYANGPWFLRTGAPEEFMELDAGELTLYPAPSADSTDAGGHLRLTLSVAPSDISPGLPDDIATRYRDEIHVGAKARLMVMPGKAWSNPQMAVAYGQAFTAMADRATARAAMGGVAGRIPARPRFC